MKNLIRHLSSFVAPLIMGFLLPYWIIFRQVQASARPLWIPALALRLIGGLIFLAGLTLLITTIRMFILIGQGTIMPWDPTRRLITAGLYAYVRNPMILSVLTLQIGEALLFASVGVALLAAVFFIINTLYFTFSEEPGLEKRFGAEYLEYKQHVPMWIPRIKPWRPG